jgi:hypothetical protein
MYIYTTILPLFVTAYQAIGVKVHGIGTYFYFHDDLVVGGANVAIECLNRTLKHLQEEGYTLPPVLYLQADNCIKDNKNKYVMGYIAHLVESNIFKKVKFNFLMKGHTHTDIDQVST